MLIEPQIKITSCAIVSLARGGLDMVEEGKHQDEMEENHHLLKADLG